MNISPNNYDAIEQMIFNEELRIKDLQFFMGEDYFYVLLNSGATFKIPFNYTPNLEKATIEGISNFKLQNAGIGIFWPDLDEDISLKGIIKKFLVHQIHEMKILEVA